VNSLQIHSPEIGSLLSYQEQLSTSWHSVFVSNQNKCFTNTLLCQFEGNSSVFWGYEVKLKASDIPPDFLVCIDSARKLNVLQTLEKPFFEAVHWHKLKNFLKVWQQSSSVIGKDVSNIWLEFDQKQMYNGIYSPSLFLAPSPLYRGADLAKLAKEAFEPIIEKSLSIELLKNCIKAYDSLPINAWIPQFGMMLPRTTERLRMYIQNMDASQTASYLETMGWQHDVQKVQNIINALLTFCKKVDLDINLGETIGDTIGLECYFSLNDFEGMIKMADYFLNQEFAVKSQVASLLKYIEQMQEATLKGALGNEYLHHFKITYSPFGSVEAKVYLAIKKN
jgi:hypothetical protein